MRGNSDGLRIGRLGGVGADDQTTIRRGPGPAAQPPTGGGRSAPALLFGGGRPPPARRPPPLASPGYCRARAPPPPKALSSPSRWSGAAASVTPWANVGDVVGG